MSGQVRVFVASSLDGFIAGENDDLSWLPPPEPGASDNGFGEFLEGVGALLMGRRTFDVVAGFNGPWPYGDRPVLVATSRDLSTDLPMVRRVDGAIGDVINEAKKAAGPRDVYIDGGALIRSALSAGLIDQVTITFVPAVLGRGLPLFAGIGERALFKLLKCTQFPNGLVQVVYSAK